MTELLSLPKYIYAVPASAVVVAIVVSKLLNISQFASFIGAFAPLALPYSELAVEPSSLFSKPHVQIASGWGMALGCALVWVAFRTIVRIAKGPLGLMRLSFSILLFTSAAVVTILLVKPELLATHTPAWRQSIGGLLFATTVLGVVLYFVRLFKSAALLVLCSVASLILGSQVFFSKMPYELGDAEFTKIRRALPSSLPDEIVESGMKGVVTVTTSTRKALRSAASDDVES